MTIAVKVTDVPYFVVLSLEVTVMVVLTLLLTVRTQSAIPSGFIH